MRYIIVAALCVVMSEVFGGTPGGVKPTTLPVRSNRIKVQSLLNSDNAKPNREKGKILITFNAMNKGDTIIITVSGATEEEKKQINGATYILQKANIDTIATNTDAKRQYAIELTLQSGTNTLPNKNLKITKHFIPAKNKFSEEYHGPLCNLA